MGLLQSSLLQMTGSANYGPDCYMHYFINSNWNGQLWPDTGPGPIDGSHLCYQARAYMLYNNWKSFDQQHQSPYYNDYKMAFSTSFPGYWTANQYTTTGKGIYEYMKDIGEDVTSFKLATDAMIDQDFKPALEAVADFITDLVGNTSTILIPIGQEAMADMGLFTTAQLTHRIIAELKTEEPLFKADITTSLNKIGDKNIAKSTSSLSTKLSSSITDFESDLNTQWAAVYGAGNSIRRTLKEHSVTLNTMLEGKMTTRKTALNGQATTVRGQERALNASVIAGSAALISGVSQLQTALAGVLSPPLINMLTIARQADKTASSTALTTAMNKMKDWLATQINTKKQPFTPAVAQAIQTAFTTIRGNLTDFATKANTTAYNASLDALINKTIASFLRNSLTLNRTIDALPTAVSGREFQLGNATASASIISNYVSGLSAYSTTQGQKSTDLSDDIDTASTSMAQQIRDGTMSTSLFGTLHGSIGDIYKERDSLLSSASADVAQMTALMASLAASVGMDLDTFMGEMLKAQAALSQLASSDASADASSTASSLGQKAMKGLEEQAAEATKAAQSGQSNINSIATSLAGSMNQASLDASAKAAAAMGRLGDSTSGLSESDGDVTAGLNTAAADNLSTVTILSGVLGAAQSAADSLNSQMKLTGAAGAQRIAMSGGTIAKAFGDILTNILTVLEQIQKKYSDSSNSLLDTNSAPITAMVAAAQGAVSRLRNLAEELEDGLAGMKSEIGLSQVEETFGIVADSIEKRRSSGDVDYTKTEATLETANSTLAGDRATQAKKTLTLQSTELTELSGIAEKLVKAREDFLSTNADAWKTIAENFGNVTLGVQPRNDSLILLQPVHPALEADLAADLEKLTAFSLASPKVASAAAGVMGEETTTLNSTLDSLLLDVHNQTVINLGLVRKALAETSVNISTDGTVQLADLVNGITGMTAGSPEAKSLSLDIAETMLDLVDAMNISSASLEEFVKDSVSNQSKQAELKVLVPFFGLSGDTRTYAKMATAGLSASTLASQAMSAASSELMSGAYNTAKSAQSQAAIALGLSQADAASELKQADIENEVNEKLAKAAAAATLDAVKRYRGQLQSSVRQGQLEIQEASLNLQLLNATWKSQVGEVTSDLSSGLSNATSEISGAFVQGATAATGNVMSDIMEMWTNYTDVDKMITAGIPGQANAGIVALQGSVQAAAVRSEAEIKKLLDRVGSMLDSMNTIRVTGDSLAQFPTTAGDSLDTVRTLLAGLQNGSVSELEKSIANLVQERKAQAAANILGIYNSMSSIVDKTHSTALRLAQFTNSN